MAPERTWVPEPFFVSVMPAAPFESTPEYVLLTPDPGLRVIFETPLKPVVMTEERFPLPLSPPKVGVVTLLRVMTPAPEVSIALFCSARALERVSVPALTVVVPL